MFNGLGKKLTQISITSESALEEAMLRIVDKILFQENRKAGNLTLSSERIYLDPDE